MAERKSAQIIATAFSYGSKHDFQLFKDDACEFSEHLRILADAGYQGLMELHENSQTPYQEIQIPCADEARKTEQSEFGTEADCD
jgi:hypothetical protein